MTKNDRGYVDLCRFLMANLASEDSESVSQPYAGHKDDIKPDSYETNKTKPPNESRYLDERRNTLG
jgi:hypothetical protein